MSSRSPWLVPSWRNIKSLRRPCHSRGPSESRRSFVGVSEAAKLQKPKTKLPTPIYEVEGYESSRGRDLPPIDQWRKYFPHEKETSTRISLRNPTTTDALANALVPEGSLGKVIIESDPGPGQLTRSLLKLPRERIKKLIVLEPNNLYLQYIRPLQEIDDRVVIYEQSGYEWGVYNKLEDAGELDDVLKVPWTSGVHPQLAFITHTPTTVLGEQLIAQLFRGIPDRQWLFQYGRVPLCFMMSSRMWKRLDAPMGGTQRCKVGVMGAATSEITELLPYEATQPFKDHFHPVPYAKYAPVPSKHPDSRRVGNPYQVVLTVPREFQAIQPGHLDYWDYCLRKMFVQKATPLKASINSLGPGATTLLKKLTDHNLPPSEQVDIRKCPNNLNVHEWSLLVKAFMEWPFAPEDLAIDTVFCNTNEHR